MRVRKKEIKTLGTKLIHLVSWCSEECAKLHDFVYKFSKNFRGTVCFLKPTTAPDYKTYSLFYHNQICYKKPIFILRNCTKTHLRQCSNPKIFRG